MGDNDSLEYKVNPGQQVFVEPEPQKKIQQEQEVFEGEWQVKVQHGRRTQKERKVEQQQRRESSRIEMTQKLSFDGASDRDMRQSEHTPDRIVRQAEHTKTQKRSFGDTADRTLRQTEHTSDRDMRQNEHTKTQKREHEGGGFRLCGAYRRGGWSA